jgi:hypothetical protein
MKDLFRMAMEAVIITGTVYTLKSFFNLGDDDVYEADEHS